MTSSSYTTQSPIFDRAGERDTIAAIATAAGRGGVGIVRLSGSEALSIGEKICQQQLKVRYAHFSHYRNNEGIELDSGITLFFKAPHSFTGEDVVELQAHGGPVILDILLRECCALGARTARPGEFSERAYLNDKLDLSQAEAIADLINSSTEQAALNASRSLQGAFSVEIAALMTAVTQLRVYVEAAIDFPEEEIDFLADGQVAIRLADIIAQLQRVYLAARQGSLLQEGMKLVIAGKPNAGKSSLLNALAGQDSAIVTSQAGTTRDVLREHIAIDGMPLQFVDTAGLRESGDEIEQEGIRRAHLEMASADRILLVIDASAEDEFQSNPLALLSESLGEAPSKAVTLIYNKCDVVNRLPALEEGSNYPCVYLSAKNGDGVDLLRNHLKNTMGYSEQAEGNFSARRRHLELLKAAESLLLQGQKQLLGAGAGELLAEDLRQSHDCLGEISGRMTSDELLGEIFSNFCIGK